MLRVRESRAGMIDSRYIREFELISGEDIISVMRIELKSGKILIHTPDRPLEDNYRELLVRSVIAAAAKTGMTLITYEKDYTIYGFREENGIFSAKAEDINFPHQCNECKYK